MSVLITAVPSTVESDPISSRSSLPRHQTPRTVLLHGRRVTDVRSGRADDGAETSGLTWTGRTNRRQQRSYGVPALERLDPMTTVMAFDRDHTIDVNPHPEKDAVPLEWLVELNRREEVEAWAIGNQRLTHEAGVPGVAELQKRLGESPLEASLLGLLTWIDGLLPPALVDGVVVRPIADRIASVSMPTRRERLRLLERLFPDADAYVVVDDVDLSDVDGWEHHFPWEFVREFRNEFEERSVVAAGFEFDLDGQ